MGSTVLIVEAWFHGDMACVFLTDIKKWIFGNPTSTGISLATLIGCIQLNPRGVSCYGKHHCLFGRHCEQNNNCMTQSTGPDPEDLDGLIDHMTVRSQLGGGRGTRRRSKLK